MCVHYTQEFYTKYTSCTFITLAETSVTTPLSKQGICSYLDRNEKKKKIICRHIFKDRYRYSCGVTHLFSAAL